jgi:DNA-binding response OmpR family regulator
MTEGRVLVVDDEPHIVRPCIKALNIEGYKAQGAFDGQEALTLLQQQPFDLLLLDLKMPDMSGLEVLQQAKDLDPDIAAIIITGYGTLEAAIEAMRLGALDFVTKPLDIQVIINKVHQAIRHIHRPETIVRGNLRSMNLTSIISINCNEGTLASLKIQHQDQQATVFFEKGEIVHAVLGGQTGEEVVYELLSWEEGDFVMTVGHSAPERTIYTGWSGLLLEGLRRIDETSFDQELLAPDAEEQDELAAPIWPEEFDEPLHPPRERAPAYELDSETQDQMAQRLAQLHQALEPRCILLTNRSGRVLDLHGEIGTSRALSLAALVAGSFSATGEIAEILAHKDETGRFQQSLQEGADFSLYSAQVDTHLILAVAFEPASTQLGLARQFTLQAAQDLADLATQASAVQAVTAEQHQEVTRTLDESFRQEVSDALGGLFD